MACTTIVKEMKEIHKCTVIVVKLGSFYRVFGKDAYIFAKLFKYKLVKVEDVPSCSFPLKIVKKIKSTLERKKISHIFVDSKDSYNVISKDDYKKLNTYQKEYEESKKYIEIREKIDMVINFLNKNEKKEDILNILGDMEKVIYERRKV